MNPTFASPGVHAVMTTRAGGVSVGAYASLNLGCHVGDDPVAVAENRRRTREQLALPAEPAWLEQVHGTDVVELPVGYVAASSASPPRADAAVTGAAGVVLAILVADCLPVLFASRDGRRVGAAHAGWRGLAAGVLERTLERLNAAPDAVQAWIGPGIGPTRFEVGGEVRAAFCDRAAGAASAFAPSATGRWMCDLTALARQRLAAVGVHDVSGGLGCTHSDPARWFSHRRSAPTGRMAALIWRTDC